MISQMGMEFILSRAKCKKYWFFKPYSKIIRLFVQYQAYISMKLSTLLTLLGAICLSTTSYSFNPAAVEKAFVLKLTSSPRNYQLNWSILPQYYLYRDKIKISSEDNSHIKLVNIHYPKASLKTHQQLGSYPVYRNKLRLPFTITALKPGTAKLNIAYQGCADSGFCYPPITTEALIDINPDLTINTFYLAGTKPPLLQLSPIKPILLQYPAILVMLSFIAIGFIILRGKPR